MSEKVNGVWVPEEMFKKWESLQLKSPAWNLLLVMAHQQYRYGGTEARITLQKVAERTGRSLSTVKRSVRELRQKDMLAKLGRGRWVLIGVNTVTASNHKKFNPKKVDMLTPSGGHDHEPFSILLFSLLDQEIDKGRELPFSEKQIQTLNSVLSQLKELSGLEVLDLSVGDDGPRTYKGWLKEVIHTKSKKQAGLFIRAMLDLTNDERVIGKELTY